MAGRAPLTHPSAELLCVSSGRAPASWGGALTGEPQTRRSAFQPSREVGCGVAPPVFRRAPISSTPHSTGADSIHPKCDGAWWVDGNLAPVLLTSQEWHQEGPCQTAEPVAAPVGHQEALQGRRGPPCRAHCSAHLHQQRAPCTHKPAPCGDTVSWW